MNNKNFDRLKNIEVPESWIENAINIPNVVPKKKPLAFPRINRYLAAVACLVLVCSVSLVIALRMDKDVIPTKPMISNKDNSNNETTAPTNEGNVPPVINTEEPTEKPVIETTNEQEEKPTDENGATQEPLDPNGKPSNPDTNPSEPTDRPETPPTPPLDGEGELDPPTSAPTPEPTYEPTPEPTPEPDPEPDPEAPEDAPTVEVYPDDPALPPPSSPTPQYPSYGNPPAGSDVFIEINVNKIPNYSPSNKIYIYCEVRDPDGITLGSQNLFSAEKLVTIFKVSDNYAYCAYSIKNHYTLTKHGRYTAYFYDANGKNIGSAYYWRA